MQTPPPRLTVDHEIGVHHPFIPQIVRSPSTTMSKATPTHKEVTQGPLKTPVNPPPSTNPTPQPPKLTSPTPPPDAVVTPVQQLSPAQPPDSQPVNPCPPDPDPLPLPQWMFQLLPQGILAGVPASLPGTLTMTCKPTMWTILDQSTWVSTAL